MMLTDHSLYIKNIATGEERNTLIHWHMQPATELNFTPPEPKYSFEDTPGSDGSSDATENIADRVLFENRTGEWEFYISNRPALLPNMDETVSWAQIQSDISNFLHGQKVEIILADDPGFYYVGRLKIKDFDPNKYYQHIFIEYDVEPYKYEREEYDSGTLTVSTSRAISAAGSPMATLPLITIHSNKFAFHQHDELTRAEAIYMLAQLGRNDPVSLTETKFLDVSENDYYYDAVLWAEQYGITAGITDHIFGGGTICTRAQFITMLYAFYKRHGQTFSVKGNIPFSDVKVNSYYYNPVRWAWNRNPQIVVGDGQGHFMPNEPMTRQHACAMIYKYMGEPTYTDTSDFIDLAGTEVIAPWYYVAVVKLYNEGIVSGYADGTYKPGNYITRGQFVTMLYAAGGKPSVSSLSHPFTDVTSDMYCDAAVTYCYNLGCISGTSETTFSPERSMLRKEMLQVLFRWGNILAQSNPNLDYFDPDGEEDNDDAVASGYEVASDVPEESYYFYAVAWGVMHGITTLNAGNMFYPDQKATRAMAAQMLYKLLKILNNWEDDDAATIDQSGSTTTTTEDIACDTSSANWRQGYYDSAQNDLITDNNYIRTIFFGLSDSSDYGTVSKVTIRCPSTYKYRVHWFSYVDSTTQTFLSQTSWITGNGANRQFSKPSSATYFMVSVAAANADTSGGTYTEDWTMESTYWRVGTIDGDTGTVDTSVTSRLYLRAMLQVADVGLDSLDFEIENATNSDIFRIYFYDSNRNFIDWLGGYTTTDGAKNLRVSTFPSGTYYIRLTFSPQSTSPTTSEGERLKITAIFTSGGGNAVSPSDGQNISMFKTYTKSTYLPPVSDIKKYTVNYSDAIKYCYDDEIIDEPMIERAPMDVTLENSKGTTTATLPSGSEIAPELVVVDGENEFTVEGNGTVRIQFKRGSL